MKPGIKHWLEIELTGMDEYWEDLQQIEILFRQHRPGSSAEKRVLWTPDGNAEICRRGEGNTLLILWTRDDTYRFKENEIFWMDIRPTLKSGLDLQVDPVQLRMAWTLFKDEVGT